MRSVTVLGPLAGRVGAGDGQAAPGPAQVAGTGPIAVAVALAAPFNGTLTLDGVTVIVWPATAWLNPAHVRANVTLCVTVSPGA
jgi:hypothetical protein